MLQNEYIYSNVLTCISLRYELALNSNATTWCTLFSDEMITNMDFYNDLEKFYECGTGYKISYEIAAPLLTDIVDSIRNISTDPSNAIQGYFRFAHAETTIPLMCLFGLCQEDKLYADFSSDEIVHRQFKTSVLSPFAANLVFNVYQCDTTTNPIRIKAYQNEVEKSIPGCGSKNYCTLADFDKQFSSSLNYDFVKECQV